MLDILMFCLRIMLHRNPSLPFTPALLLLKSQHCIDSLLQAACTLHGSICSKERIYFEQVHRQVVFCRLAQVCPKVKRGSKRLVRSSVGVGTTVIQLTFAIAIAVLIFLLFAPGS